MTDKPTPPRRAAPPPDQSAYARGRAKFERDFGEPTRLRLGATQAERDAEALRGTAFDPWDDCC